ncbi:hypothetical protein PsorP6_008155 [Peronosclerospora sorghi]|uniref:Uncharacterized protein n=1 Tax=Peronosclerospora sorghi TaxID=230839 RepID=A0ACC0W6F9_9STRA|nr:hypothetical protein PsorP6_008155 [Peronosclerospora sorghi]
MSMFLGKTCERRIGAMHKFCANINAHAGNKARCIHYAAAYTVRCLDNQYVLNPFDANQLIGTAQTCNPGANHYHVMELRLLIFHIVYSMLTLDVASKKSDSSLSTPWPQTRLQRKNGM